MKVEIISNDNGSGMSTTLTVLSDYNPMNKVFNKTFCLIEEDDFLSCFKEKYQDKIFEKMQSGKTLFDVNKDALIEKCKKLF